MRRPVPDLAGTGATSTKTVSVVGDVIVVAIVEVVVEVVVEVAESLVPALADATLALPIIEIANTAATITRFIEPLPKSLAKQMPQSGLLRL
jgi:fibrillarin-like rRNA methylase